MRIISGKFKSRRLKGKPPPGVRPTSDKLRETLFNVLGTRVEGAIFLDGCAGAGAIGIEALSRGAGFVFFIEQSRKACQIIRENLKALEIREGFKNMETDLIKALSGLDMRFDIAFVDLPYDREDLYERVLDMFGRDMKSTRLNSSRLGISYAVFCLKKKSKKITQKIVRKHLTF